MPRHPTANVRCPHCDYAYSRQTSSTTSPDGYLRKRICLSDKCGRRFNTYEVHARSITLLRNVRKWMEESES